MFNFLLFRPSFSGEGIYTFVHRPDLVHNCARNILLSRRKVGHPSEWTRVRPIPKWTSFSGPFVLCKGKDPKTKWVMYVMTSSASFFYRHALLIADYCRLLLWHGLLGFTYVIACLHKTLHKVMVALFVTCQSCWILELWACASMGKIAILPSISWRSTSGQKRGRGGWTETCCLKQMLSNWTQWTASYAFYRSTRACLCFSVRLVAAYTL